jgi:hypothetical protein
MKIRLLNILNNNHPNHQTTMNIQEIKQTYRIEEVIGRSVTLKRQGTELVGNCPFHDDHHASMKVNPVKQQFKCFVCGASKDMFDFFTLQGYSLPEAGKMITSGVIIESAVPSEKIAEVIWEDDIPNQENLPNPLNVMFPKYGKPDAFWPYTTADNKINGYVQKTEFQNQAGGGKDSK